MNRYTGLCRLFEFQALAGQPRCAANVVLICIVCAAELCLKVGPG